MTGAGTTQEGLMIKKGLILYATVLVYGLSSYVAYGNGWWGLTMIPGTLVLFMVFGAVVGERRARHG